MEDMQKEANHSQQRQKVKTKQKTKNTSTEAMRHELSLTAHHHHLEGFLSLWTCIPTSEPPLNLRVTNIQNIIYSSYKTV